MYIVSNGDYLLEISNLVFWEKLKKYYQFVFAEFARVVKVNTAPGLF